MKKGPRHVRCTACGKARVSAATNVRRFGDRRCDECREKNRPPLPTVEKAKTPRKAATASLPAPKRPRPPIPLPPNLETMRRTIEPYAAAVDKARLALHPIAYPRRKKP